MQIVLGIIKDNIKKSLGILRYSQKVKTKEGFDPKRGF